MLGIVIGVAAVILLVSICMSAGQLMQDQFLGLGTNVIIITPGSQNDNGVRTATGGIPTLSAADADAIAAECPSVLAATPIVNAPRAGRGRQLRTGRPTRSWASTLRT